MKTKYIRGAIRMIVSSSATENGYIFDWVVRIIVRIHIFISIGVCDRDKISSKKKCVIIYVRLVHDNSIIRWFMDCLRFSDSPLRQDVPDLMAIAIPQTCLLIFAAHYGPCGPSEIDHLQHILINIKLCCLAKFYMI